MDLTVTTEPEPNTEKDIKATEGSGFNFPYNNGST